MTIDYTLKSAAVFVLACLIAFPNLCDARSFGGSRSRSSFSSSSRRPSSSYRSPSTSNSSNRGSSTYSKPSTPSSSHPKTSTTEPTSSSSSRSATKSWSDSKPKSATVSRPAAKETPDTTTTPKTAGPVSKVDSKLAVAAKSSTVQHKDRAAAIAAFKARNQDKYTAKFDSKPETRPSYIPRTYNRGGTYHDVTYSPQHRGYGYMQGDRWTYYEPYDDPTTMNYLLRHNGYGYHEPVYSQPVIHSSPPAHAVAQRQGTYVPHYRRGRSGLGTIFFIGLAVVIFFVGAAVVIAGITMIANKNRMP